MARLPRPRSEGEPPDALDRALTAWLAEKSPKTARTYREAWNRAVRAYPALSPALDVEGARRCVAALAAAGYAPHTVTITVRALAALWQEWVAAGRVPENPWRRVRVRPPKDKRPERLLTEHDVQRLFDHAGSPRNRVFLRFLYLTACRIAEATSVTWGDLRRDQSGEGLLTIYGKGGRTRVVRLPAGFTAELLRWRRGAPADARIWEFSPQRGWEIVRAAADRAGLGRPVSPHWLRHAHATHALEAGVPLQVVQATLGHARLDTTGEYLHLLPGRSSALALERKK